MSTAVYDQRSGEFTIYSPVDDGGIERVVYQCVGYAGKGDCKNNPDCQHRVGEGPLPIGRYKVRLVLHARFANPVFRLEQVAGDDFGRSGFLIHGPRVGGQQNSSSGCIVLRYDDRVAVGHYSVRELEVCASSPTLGRTRTRTVTK